jgi:hypothetical protein
MTLQVDSAVEQLLRTSSMLRDGHRIDEALDVIEYGLSLAPGHGELLFSRGKALQDLGAGVWVLYAFVL